MFSGGKSVHAYIAFQVPLVADDPIREEIQRLLVVTLEGDTRIVNRGRLMRLPGWSGRERQQPVLHFDADAAYDAVDLRDRLLTYAGSLGITDVKVAYDTLFLAERLGQQARHEVESEVADALLEQAELLRATRGAPDPREVRVARAMLGSNRSVAVGGVPVAGGTVAVENGAAGRERVGAAVWFDMPVPNPYVGVPPRTAVDAPCCLQKGGRKGTLYENGNVWCHRHGWGFRPGGSRVPDEPVAEVTDGDLNDFFGDDVVVDLDAERAERERERAETDRRNADLHPLHERARAKRAEAEALDPEVVAGARAAMKFAKEVVGDVRQILGVGNERVGCGIHLMLQSAASGQVNTLRAGCGRLSCRSCGPMAVACKIGAVLMMPVVSDGVTTGEAIGNRPVWIYSVESRCFDSFRKRWTRECPRFSIGLSIKRKSDTRVADAFAAFHLGEKAFVLSTFEMPETGRSKVGRLVTTINDAEHIQNAVLWLGLSAYRVDEDPDIGIRVVVGKISSSRGLHLDPAGIARKAAASPWIAVALHTKPKSVSEAMQARQVQVHEQREHDEVTSVRSVGSVSLETAVNIAVAAGGWVRVEPDVVVDEVELTSVFEQAG